MQAYAQAIGACNSRLRSDVRWTGKESLSCSNDAWGAVAGAVDDFAAAESRDAATATKLRKAAVKGAVEAHKTVTRLSLGRSKNEEHDRFAVEWWLRCVPSYWEEPTVSPEFQKMLDRIGSSRQQG